MAVIANRTIAVALGVVLLIAGFWLLHDAFEGHGIPKPFWTHFLPGL